MPTTLTPLDALMAKMEIYVNFSMRIGGFLVPTVVTDGLEGSIMFKQLSLDNKRTDQDLAATVQLACIVGAATACVTAREAWMVSQYKRSSAFARPGSARVRDALWRIPR